MKKIICILLILLCTGCYNYHELSDEAIVLGLGFDLDNDKYVVSLMIANSQAEPSSKNSNASTTIIKGSGESISEAIKDAEKEIPKDIYLGHIKTIVINEEIANNSIYPIVDYLTRNPESLKKVFVIISHNSSSEEILKTLSPLENFPAQSIVTNIKNAGQSLGISNEVLLSEFIGNTLNEGIENVLPIITIDGSSNNADSSDDLKETDIKGKLRLDGLATFKNYSLITINDNNISKGINILNNNINSLELYIPCYIDLDKYIVTKLTDIKTNIIFDKNLKYSFNVSSNSVIHETNCKLDLENKDVIKNIENSLNSYIYDLVDKTINSIKENKSDILGLGNMIYKKDYKLWNDISSNWQQYIKELNYDISINNTLKGNGSIKNTIKEYIYEEN